MERKRVQAELDQLVSESLSGIKSMPCGITQY